MPKSDGPAAKLDTEAAPIDSLSVVARFKGSDQERLALTLESHWTAGGSRTFELSGGPANARGTLTSNPWRTRGKTLSTGLRAFCKEFPEVVLPPTHLQLHCRGARTSMEALQGLLLEVLAEALGRELPSNPPAIESKKASPGPADWVTVLRSGPDGLKKWNRLQAAERKRIKLDDADLGGIDLSGMNLRGVSAKQASFAKAKLTQAGLSEGHFDRANFSQADLNEASLKGARATEANFLGANLEKANLSGGMCFGASFAGANLNRADLNNSNLCKANFQEARLDDANLDRASFDLQTQWPVDFVIPAEVLFIGRGTDPRLKGKGKKAVATDINGLMARLNASIDPKRMKRTLDMLKSGKNQLFSEIEPTFVRGIVRSQTADDLVYSCVLMDNGSYACCTPDLSPCLGLRGEPCKHLLVLLIGLARAGELDPATIDPWLVTAVGKNHRWNKTTKNHVSDTLLRYQGVQAGEIDWRPTETIPEDFYTF
ncbi:hypothetical protein BH23PLA1_BH23PLA1_25080 [soil metagenome]